MQLNMFNLFNPKYILSKGISLFWKQKNFSTVSNIILLMTKKLFKKDIMEDKINLHAKYKQSE